MLRIAIVLFGLTLVSCGRPREDLITYLPRLDAKLGFEMYSGYLQGQTENIQLHYWFAEASENSANAPLVLWLNGGPGCSSLMGLLTEHGPVLMNGKGRLVENPHSWNKFANILYLEAPAGVGYSYARDGYVVTNDDKVADNNAAAVSHFFEKFPEFKGRDFYISGESYAGVYLPTLGQRLIKHPDIKFKAMAVGNGLTSYVLNDNSLIYFAYYHSLFDGSLWETLVNYCCGGKLVGRCLFTENQNPTCKEAVANVSSIINYGLNVYNLYGPCAGGVPQESVSISGQLAALGNLFRTNPIARSYFKQGLVTGFSRQRKLSRDQADLGNLFRSHKHLATSRRGRLSLVIPCSDDSELEGYLNDVQVRTALHVHKDVGQWETCSSAVYNGYGRVYRDLTEQYTDLLNNKIRTLIFNGDTDMACNALGDEWFTNDLGLPILESRAPWFFNATDGTRQIGGYMKTFQMKSSGTNLTFLTVRGAGHMVPTDKPVPAHTLFRNFLNNLYT